MPVFTEARLKHFAPHIHPDLMSGFLLFNADEILIDAGIVNQQIVAFFMGQCFVETAGFTTWTESFHYSAERLMKVFGRRKFPSLHVAQQYAGNPIKTASYVYGGRMGNNTTGDGYKFRGAGYLDLTGADNYRAMSKKTGIDVFHNPQLMCDPHTALQIAAQCFKALGAVAAAAQDDLELVTQRVNGGQNGAAEREAATDRASIIFTEAPVHSGHGIADLPQTEPDDGEFDAPAGPMAVIPREQATDPNSAKVPTVKSATQAKQIQQQLKEKNFSPGEVTGNLSDPSTVGAIATVQSQEGIPVTGTIDDETENAIANTAGKVVSENRSLEDAKTLRAKGSQTIAAADSIDNNTHAITASGIGTVAIGAGGLISAVKDQVDQVKSVTDNVPGLSDKIAVFISEHISVIALTALGCVLLFVATRLYKKSAIVVSERVRKSRTGEDMSH